MKRNRPEHDLQCSIIHWAKLHEWKFEELQWLYAIPNAGQRTGRQGKDFVEEGLKAGVPDLCLPVPRGGYGAFYIELKTKTGKVSEHQRVWLNGLTRNGNCCMVSRSYDDCTKMILKYLRGEIIKDGLRN